MTIAKKGTHVNKYSRVRAIDSITGDDHSLYVEECGVQPGSLEKRLGS